MPFHELTLTLEVQCVDMVERATSTLPMLVCVEECLCLFLIAV